MTVSIGAAKKVTLRRFAKAAVVAALLSPLLATPGAAQQNGEPMPKNCSQNLDKCSQKIWKHDSFSHAGDERSITFSNDWTLTCTSNGANKPRSCRLSETAANQDNAGGDNAGGDNGGAEVCAATGRCTKAGEMCCRIRESGTNIVTMSYCMPKWECDEIRGRDSRVTCTSNGPNMPKSCTLREKGANQNNAGGDYGGGWQRGNQNQNNAGGDNAGGWQRGNQNQSNAGGDNGGGRQAGNKEPTVCAATGRCSAAGEICCRIREKGTHIVIMSYCMPQAECDEVLK